MPLNKKTLRSVIDRLDDFIDDIEALIEENRRLKNRLNNAKKSGALPLRTYNTKPKMKARQPLEFDEKIVIVM